MWLTNTTEKNVRSSDFRFKNKIRHRLVLSSLFVSGVFLSVSTDAAIPLVCADQTERDQMNINEIRTGGGSTGSLQFAEIKILKDQVELTQTSTATNPPIYELCVINKTDKTPECQQLGTGLGVWNNSGFFDNNGPDANNPTTFNENTWIVYDFGNIDPLEAELVIKNIATQEVLDYLCYANKGACTGTGMYWDVPVDCANLLTSDPKQKTFSRSPDGDGGWSNNSDPSTTGSGNEGEITNADICTDLANEQFVALYAENQLIFKGDYWIEVTDSDGTDSFNSGSAKIYNGPAAIDSDAFYQGGLYSVPALLPVNFPIFTGPDVAISAIWTNGDYGQVTIEPGTVATGGSYRARQVTVRDSLTSSPSLDLGSGDYFIDNLDVWPDAELIIRDPNTHIFIHTDAKIATGSQLTPNSNDPGDLTLNLYPGANLTFGDNVTFTGNIVAMGSTSSITIGKNFSLTGSIISEGNITINGDIAINYNTQTIASQEKIFDCTPATAAYFRITTASNGLTCSAQPVNISAYRLDDTLATDYVGTVIINNKSLTATDTGDWLDSAGTELPGNGTQDDGTTSLNFSLADAGSIDLLLSNTHSGNFNIDVLDTVIAITESSTFDPDTSYTDAGFLWQDTTGTPIPSVTTPFFTAGFPENIQIRAVTTDPATGVCTDLFSSGTDVMLEIGSQCNDPLTCAAGQRVVASNNGLNFTIANPENQILGQNYSSQLIQFGANSTASLALNSPDVGQIRFTARHSLLNAGGIATGAQIIGDSIMVVKPDHLSITAITDSSGNPNPGTTTAVGGTNVFAKAGEVFHLKVEGRSSTGAITPSFGRETVTPQPDINGSTYYPATGHTGTLTRSGSWVPAADPGTVEFDLITNGLTYSEVGALTTSASLNNYLGAGSVTGTDSSVIGRFKPDRFDIVLNTPAIDSNIAACGFVYRGQDLSFDTVPSYEITALNTLGIVTKNYDQEFFTLPATLNIAGLEVTNAGVPWIPEMNWTGQWLQNPGYDGLVSFQIDNLNLSKNEIPTTTEAVVTNPTVRIGLLDMPVTGLSLIHDADNTCYEPSGICQNYTSDLVVNGIQWLYGRAALTNVYGSEIRNLDMPVTLQYWDGSFWRTQILDTACTSLLSTDFTLGSWSTETGTPTTSISSWTGISLGSGVLTLGAPGAGNTGTIPVTLSVPSWLKYHWDDDYLNVAFCAVDSDLCLDNPTASAKFGIYEGRHPILFRFQVFK